MNSRECLYAILGMLNYEQVNECEKNNYLKIISQDLDRLEKENQELKEELNQCQDTINTWMENHKSLIIDNGKLKKAFKLLKDNFEVIICKNGFPIFKYSIGFKINNDGVYAHIPQEDCELLEEVFNYE